MTRWLSTCNLSGSTSTATDDLSLPYILQKDNLLTICMIVSLSTSKGSAGNLDVLQRVMQMSPNHESWTYCRNTLRKICDRYTLHQLAAPERRSWYHGWIYQRKMGMDVAATLLQVTIERLDKYFVGEGYRQEERRPTPVGQTHFKLASLGAHQPTGAGLYGAHKCQLESASEFEAECWPWATFRTQAPVMVLATFDASNGMSGDGAANMGLELAYQRFGTTSNVR